MLYESLLMLGVLALTFLIPHLLLGIFLQTALPGIVLWLHIFLVMGAYFVWYWRHGGQTLAMQTWKIQLVSVQGGQPSLRQAWLRYGLAWLGITFFGAGLIWAFFDRDRQFLQDRFAGTRIIFKQPD